MKGKFVRYWVLLIFIFVAAILYFLGEIAGEYIYDRFIFREELIDQVFNKLYFTYKFWAVYVLLLLSTASVGIFWSNKRGRKEVNKGFTYSMIFSALIFVIYIIALGYLLMH